jgi:6-phosphofructokinase 1
VPASIDNDIYGTDMCIGVDTALNTIVDAIDKLRDTASSHNTRLPGRNHGRESGYLAVQAGIVTGAELVLIPEFRTPPKEVAAAIERGLPARKDARHRGGSRGLQTSYNRAGGYDRCHGYRIYHARHHPGDVQRGGKPTAFDRLIATRFGVKAVEFLLEGKSNVMAGLVGRDIQPIPIDEVISNKKVLSKDYIDMARIWRDKKPRSKENARYSKLAN